MFGHNDAFCRLQPFLRKWRAAAEAAAAAGTSLQPYIGAPDTGGWTSTVAMHVAMLHAVLDHFKEWSVACGM